MPITQETQQQKEKQSRAQFQVQGVASSHVPWWSSESSGTGDTRGMVYNPPLWPAWAGASGARNLVFCCNDQQGDKGKHDLSMAKNGWENSIAWAWLRQQDSAEYLDPTFSWIS